MIKLYTPPEWYSVFNNPTIIIEDDGMIYSDADYYSILRSPIGKIDYNTGYIYGSDYNDFFPRPIGKMTVKNDVTVIYGENFNDLLPRPLFFVRDNRVYTYDEFYSIFPSASAYIDGAFPGSSSSTTGASTTAQQKTTGYSPSNYNTSEPVEPGPISKLFGILIFVGIILLILFLAVMGMREAYIVNDEYFDYLIAQIVGCLVGGIYAVSKIRKTIKKKPDRVISLGDHIGESISHIYQVNCILFWMYITLQVILDVGFPWYLIFVALLDVAISMVFSIIPTGIAAVITGIISYLITPKKKARRKAAKK